VATIRVPEMPLTNTYLAQIQTYKCMASRYKQYSLFLELLFVSYVDIQELNKRRKIKNKEEEKHHKIKYLHLLQNKIQQDGHCKKPK
jgi:hypothetical protein